MKLYVSEPSERHAGPILVHDEDHNDIAEFYHNEHATVDQSYETALALAHKLVTGDVPQTVEVMARESDVEMARLTGIISDLVKALEWARVRRGL